MVGNNQLNLNAATMMQALQEWIDKRWSGKAPKVISITVTDKGNYSGETYCVGVESVPDEGKTSQQK